MKILLQAGLFALMALGAQAHHVILAGGTAVQGSERMRIEKDRHDRWWANFIRASTIRMGSIRATGDATPITWIIYRPAYEMRSREDGSPYIKWIEDLAKKYQAKLVWVRTGQGAIDAINQAGSRQRIATFDYFGHSNAYCMMLDYSTQYIGASRAWIHQNDLGKIRSSGFLPSATCHSWGCYTGESMSRMWRIATGVGLFGNTGKTDYASVSDGKLPTGQGSWVN